MTMQNVAWPTTIVHIEKPPKTKFAFEMNEFSAIPVMIPGSAIGRTTRNEITFRPKKSNRCTANDAAVPSRSATAVDSESDLDREPECVADVLVVATRRRTSASRRS